MFRVPRSSEKSKLCAIAVLAMPFLFFHHVAPLTGGNTLSSDYLELNIPNQLVLMFSWKHGQIPLFIPGYLQGNSASALILGAPWHPLCWIAALTPGYWDGHAYEIMTMLRLITLGAAHLCLIQLLRRMSISVGIAFLVSTPAVYNLRMLDCFRYAAALESYTGWILLASGIGLHWFEPRNRMIRFLMIAATYWNVASGHPQAAYYTLLGALVWGLCFPFLPEFLIGGRRDRSDILRFWTHIATCVLLGVFLCSAFLLPFKSEILSQSSDRGGGNLAFSIISSATLRDILGNFFRPLDADIHSAFGGSFIFVLGCLAPLLCAKGGRMTMGLWGLWLASIASVLFAMGERTPVHALAWRWIPFFQNLRYPGRITHCLPLFCAVLSAWLLSEEQPAGRFRRAGAIILLVALAHALYPLIHHRLGPLLYFSPEFFNSLSPRIENALALSPLCILVSVALHLLLGKRIWILAAIIISIPHLALLMEHGTFYGPARDSWTFNELSRRYGEFRPFSYTSPVGFCPEIVADHLNHAPFEPNLISLRSRAIPLTSRQAAYERMANPGIKPDEVIIEGGDQHEAENPKGVSSARALLKRGTFNELCMEVDASDSAWMVINYPWSDRWRVEVNGSPGMLLRANGAEHAVAVPPGRSRITLRYDSASARWGVIISAATLAAVAIYLFMPMSSLLLGASLAAVVIALASILGFLTMKKHSGGDNMAVEREYAITPHADSPHAAPVNLAYKKPAECSKDSNYAPLYSLKELPVDGNRTPASGWRSMDTHFAFWQVDLGADHPINRISIYRDTSMRTAVRIMARRDSETHWLSPDVRRSAVEEIWYLTETIAARVVRIESVDARLSLDEVEVY